MPLTILKHASLTQDRIDAETGVIYGVRIAELGKLACFDGPDGKPRSATITAEHVDAFLAHAGNRSIPVHWTHDYRTGDRDALHAKVGTLKSLRKDENGNPIADFHVSPGERRDAIFWNAANDPTGMMLSPVFSYDKKDARSLPLDFQAADLVACGAATTALFAAAEQANEQPQPMDINELITALQDPGVLAALKAIIKTVEKSQSDSDETAAADAAESDAGVTQADMAETDKDKPAMLRASLRIGRAIARKANEQAKEIVAGASDELLVKAEAKFTAAIGKRIDHAVAAGVAATTDFEAAVTAAMAAGNIPRGLAIRRVSADKPDLYNAHMKATTR